MKKEYLPGTIGERIRDLRRENNLSQEEFADAIGISRSTVARIESNSKISGEDALEIAKYFGVSVDFVLAKTNDPEVINYDLKVLGLTKEAAQKLYTGQVDAGVLNLLIEHDQCGKLMKLIMFYLKDYMAEARKTQNVIYSEIGNMLRAFGDEEDADAVEAQMEPAYSPDISKIHNCLDNILKDTKKKLDDNDAQFYKEAKATVAELIKDSTRVNGAMRKLQADSFASNVVNLIVSRIPLSEEIRNNLHDALVPVFKTDWRGAKK